MAFAPAKNRRKRAFEIIEIGVPDDYISRIYDIINMLSILINLIVSVLYPLRSSEPHMAVCS